MEVIKITKRSNKNTKKKTKILFALGWLGFIA